MTQLNGITEAVAYGSHVLTIDWSKKPRIEEVLSALETAAARDPASLEEPSVYAVGNLAVTPADGPNILALCRAAEQLVNIWLVICADSPETLDLVYRSAAAIHHAECIWYYPLDAADLRQTLACSGEDGTVRLVSAVSRLPADGKILGADGTAFTAVFARREADLFRDPSQVEASLKEITQHAPENAIVLPVCLGGCAEVFAQVFQSDVLFREPPREPFLDGLDEDEFFGMLREECFDGN